MKGSNSKKGSSQTEMFAPKRNSNPNAESIPFLFPFSFSISGGSQDRLADRILHFLQISASLRKRQKAMNALLYLADKFPDSDTVCRNCAKALFTQMKLETDPETRTEFLAKLETLCQEKPDDQEIACTYAMAAVHVLEVCRTQREAHAQLDVLRRLHASAIKCGFRAEKLCRLLAHGISQFLQRQKFSEKRETLLLELKHLSDASSGDLKISEEYIRGVAAVMRNVHEPEERNAWFEALEKFTERETLTAEMRAGILEGGTYWLLARLSGNERTSENILKKNTDREKQKIADCMRIQSLWRRLWCEDAQNAESRYFFACAILASMRGEPSAEKRKDLASLLAKCRSVRLTELDGLYRTSRNEFLANEWNEEVRNAILSALR